MDDDEFALSNLRRPPESDLERETLETGDAKIAEGCEFLLESGEWNEMVSSEAVTDEVGEKIGLEDNAAVKSRVVIAVVPVEELTEERGGEVMISDVEDPQLKRKPDEGSGLVDDANVASAVSDAGNAVLFSEPQVDAREDDEISVEPNLGMVVEEGFMTITYSEVEAVVADADEAPAIYGSPEYIRGDELLAASEGMELLNDRAELVMESVISEREKVEEVGVLVDFAHCGKFQNDLKVVVGGEEKVDFMENYLEAGIAEKSSGVEVEKVDLFIIEAPVTEVNVEMELITEVDTNLVSVREDEQVIESSGTDLRDKLTGNEEVSAEEKFMSETKMVEEKDICEDSVKDFKLVEPVIAAENRDVAVADEEFPAGNIGMEIYERVESDVMRNDVSMEAQLEGAEVETWTTSMVVNDKIQSESTIGVVTDPDQEMDDSPAALQDEEDEKIMDEEATEIETETEVAESGIASEGKRKRGKFSKSSSISKTSTKASSRKKMGEDVCFICFDSGELVLCGRRGCPKAYHPSCVNRDEAFFRAKGRWNCGWHMCSICEKNAVFMCYTCTFSLCKRCSKDVIISCVRGNKGFCEICKRTVMLIENHEPGETDIQNQIDFDDRGGWEYLFKHYYIQLKSKLSLSSVEVAEAKNPGKGSNAFSSLSKQGSSEAQADENDEGSGSDISIENLKTIKTKRRKLEKKPKSLTKEKELVSAGDVTGDKVLSSAGSSEWASKELLEFVSHMKNGDKSKLSQFDVQDLLLEYIKRNKLRDPRRKSQIVCDARLEIIFGKPRVGHCEMLKLLDSHFLIRDEQNEDVQESPNDIENNQLDADGNADYLTKGGKDGRRKICKGIRGPQSNLDDYAAIDMHNISLIYLHRKLMEDLLEDVQTFHDKVLGMFVRIRISGSLQKQEMYRLVQVVGTSKAEEPYKIGKRITDTLVEILNLDKIEVISVDTISNHEFTEEECKRLRQRIKCGLISRLTVGEILDKTMEIQAVKVNDWLESEIVRLSYLCDRASDLGHQKELRECVEKLQILKTPEDRQRRLKEVPEIHSDPKMDPSYESDNSNHETEDSRQDNFWRSRGSSVSRRVKDLISPESDDPVNDSWGSPIKISPKKLELSRSLSGNDFSANAPCGGEMVNENCRTSETDREPQKSNDLEKLSSAIPMLTELSRSVCGNDFSASAPCGGEMVNENCRDSETDRKPHKSNNLEKLSSANPMSAELSRSVSSDDFSSNAPCGGLLVDENCRNSETDRKPLKSNNLEKISSANSTPAEFSRSVSGNDFSANAPCGGEMVNENCSNSETDREPKKSNNLENLSSANGTTNAESEADLLSGVSSLTSRASLPAGVEEINIKVNDRKKIWHYQDPSGKVQGPFSMARLRKWNYTGYFPSDLRIWRTTEKQDHSILISNALVGKFQTELPAVDHMIPPNDTLNTTSVNHGQVIPTVDQNSGSLTKFCTEKRTGNAVTNIPILMPALGNASCTGGEGDLPSGAIQSPGVKGVLSSPSAVLRDIAPQFAVQCSGNFNPTLPTHQQGILVGSADSLHLQPTISSEPHAVQMNLHPSSMVQSVQQVSSQSPLGETQGWGSTAQSGQPQEHGWTAPNVQNSTLSLVSQSTTAGPQSEFWRPNQGSQPNVYPHATPNSSWGIAPAENNTPMGLRPEILNTGWGMQQANPNMGLGNPSAGNTNTNRGHPVQAPPRGNANSSWVGPATNAGANTQGPMPGNVNSGWTPTPGWGGPPVEGLVSGNRWGPAGSRPPVEVSAQGTSNQGWGAPQGNHGAWGGEQNHNEGQFSGQMNGQGRDSVFGGGSRPWNRQPTFGGGRGGNQHFNKGDVLCPYNAYGRCRKGAHCDYLHV